MPSDVERRRSLLTAALGFALVDTQGKPAPKEIQIVREWLDNWKGLGQSAGGHLVAVPSLQRAAKVHGDS